MPLFSVWQSHAPKRIHQNISRHGMTVLFLHWYLRKSAERYYRMVHGDIRHLEIQVKRMKRMPFVHGDIRHLESYV